LERGGSKVIWILLLLSQIASASLVKELKLKPKDVGIINTAIGYSTVIQLTSKPLNVVIGDQASFRVEFINDSITLKPIKPAKTNLFIFTENDRFNLTVKTGQPGSVDYVVRLRRVFSDPKNSVVLNKIRIQHGVALVLHRMTLKDTEAFIDFTVQNNDTKTLSLNPELFRIVQNGIVKPIRSLYLASTELKTGRTTSGSLLFPATSFGQSLAIWVGFQRQKPIHFTFKSSDKKLEVAHVP